MATEPSSRVGLAARVMNEFILGVGDRVVRVMIDDSRGPDGALPVQYPGFLAFVLADDEIPMAEVVIDVSELPAGATGFMLGDFATAAAASAFGDQHRRVTVTVDQAGAWGYLGPRR